MTLFRKGITALFTTGKKFYRETIKQKHKIKKSGLLFRKHKIKN